MNESKLQIYLQIMINKTIFRNPERDILTRHVFYKKSPACRTNESSPQIYLRDLDEVKICKFASWRTNEKIIHVTKEI